MDAVISFFAQQTVPVVANQDNLVLFLIAVIAPVGGLVMGLLFIMHKGVLTRLARMEDDLVKARLEIATMQGKDQTMDYKSVGK